MQRLDAVEGIVSNVGEFIPASFFYDAVSAFRVLLVGCRVELHFLRGELDKATRLVNIGILLIKTIARPYTHPFYFGIAGLTEVR